MENLGTIKLGATVAAFLGSDLGIREPHETAG